MESNVINLIKFREAKSSEKNEVEMIGQQGEALAIDHETEHHDLCARVIEGIFEKIEHYRFIVEEGSFDGEYEGQVYTHQIRIKGTDISAYGKSEDSAWMRMSAVLMEEGLL